MITQTGTESELISRQAAIDAIDKYSVWVMYTQGDSQKDEAEFVESIIKQTKKAIKSMLIEDLPSAQPEIIRCKDCKWYELPSHRITENCVRWMKSNGIILPIKPNDYCSYAERRTDGNQ